ncbi:MAG: VWA domain-containing protein [Spirochaetaceae bacterium]|nr:VWA domain-containing protein [Spirochaetaceae bacterium]MCF7947960.1 VWA domain-containing protein [Spirochaetia bacterium]MCF7951255.1 VWA domain-containing protein [Spirochaetaceae bacterium]
MRNKIKAFLAILGIIFGLGFGPGVGRLEAQSLTISQIDSSSLLLSQQVDLYLSVNDRQGNSIAGLEKDNFTVYESADGQEYTEISAIEKLAEQPNKEQGIHILLLIDNSGSMYDTLEGRATEDREKMRITHAKAAIRQFINRSFNPRDVVSLASFNTDLTLHSEALKDPSALEGLLESIRRPESEQAYTELYHSLDDSVYRMAGYRGRKVVVVLSDGENYPYYEHSGTPHSEYGTELLEPEEVVDSFQREGVTLYAIHFGIERDRNLGQMALKTGGNVYDARNEEELATVYQDIKQKIENEYRLTYRAGMIPTDRKYVKVEFESGRQQAEAERYYYAGTLFGIPVQPYPYLILLLIAAALLLWLLLLLLRYRKLQKNAALEVLQPGYRTKVSSSTIALTQEKTVIGGGERADLTISGLPSLKPEHATIMYDEQNGDYTLAGEGNITVNNRRISGNRKLRDGDVVNIEGTTIVFDSGTPGDKKKEKEQKPEK